MREEEEEVENEEEEVENEEETVENKEVETVETNEEGSVQPPIVKVSVGPAPEGGCMVTVELEVSEPEPVQTPTSWWSSVVEWALTRAGRPRVCAADPSR